MANTIFFIIQNNCCSTNNVLSQVSSFEGKVFIRPKINETMEEFFNASTLIQTTSNSGFVSD